MRQVYKYDDDGFFIEPVILYDGQDLSDPHTDIQPPEGLFKAKFCNNKWTEGATPEYITEVTTPKPQPPSESDVMLSGIMMQMMAMKSQIEEMQKENATLMLQIMLNSKGGGGIL